MSAPSDGAAAVDRQSAAQMQYSRGRNTFIPMRFATSDDGTCPTMLPA